MLKKENVKNRPTQTIKSLFVFSFMVVGLSQRHSSKLGGYRF
jgi:hypothetical protein